MEIKIDTDKYIRQVERDRIIARLETWGHKYVSADLIKAAARLREEGEEWIS